MIRIVVFLAIFGTLAVLVAWRASRAYIKRRNLSRRIAELEATNTQLDEALGRTQRPESEWTRRRPDR